jgi:ATP-dependent Clp protease adaptor protein ClpS
MTSKKLKSKPSGNNSNLPDERYILLLHNDNIHSFEYVIEALIAICSHKYEQAVQCTLIAHYKGCCDIKKGNLKILSRMKEALTKKGLNTTINSR